MIRLRKHKIILTLSLILAILLPNGLDGAHFLIFHHHDSVAKTSDTSFNQAENHKLCRYEFSTEIINNQVIKIINLPEFLKFEAKHKTESPKKSDIFFISLRAPPSENQY